MKKMLFIAATILVSLQLHAQILTPVKWSYGSKKTGKAEAVIFVKATIDAGWHLYSQTVKEGGPVKTTFTFAASPAYTLVGKTHEPAPITRYEKVFSMNVSFFEKQVIFQQKIKLKAGQATVKGTLEYMTCNDKQCLPPETIEFSIPVK
ncbi:protein-disulfide reductase DsbD domain-containing protein [Mucilaginibacter sp. PAMB04274]|uniref:protein-disulfide reductase DsbD domain-containing protein n=1 Tax=Mucilaginibacter sp. PAMB04274 TaxID=3138568 RepID=UPI0031F6B05B